ncbi:hypothetical protein M8994_17250 [Brucella sp. 21LCYQ03]|nr:hypothetical protein [Brucella sp. 21LCYQ03]
MNSAAVSHNRRSASAKAILQFRYKRASAARRQIAKGAASLLFRHSVNLRAIAPIYGRDRIVFNKSAVAVRRVGLPAIGRIALAGIAATTTRQTIRTSSTIALLATIKMPHFRMTPVEEIRAMQMFEEVRSMSVLTEPSPIIVAPDNRELIVPQRARNIGTPDTKDNA